MIGVNAAPSTGQVYYLHAANLTDTSVMVEVAAGLCWTKMLDPQSTSVYRPDAGCRKAYQSVEVLAEIVMTTLYLGPRKIKFATVQPAMAIEFLIKESPSG